MLNALVNIGKVVNSVHVLHRLSRFFRKKVNFFRFHGIFYLLADENLAQNGYW